MNPAIAAQLTWVLCVAQVLIAAVLISFCRCNLQGPRPNRFQVALSEGVFHVIDHYNHRFIHTYVKITAAKAPQFEIAPHVLTRSAIYVWAMRAERYCKGPKRRALRANSNGP
jgi:hypothetical protein